MKLQAKPFSSSLSSSSSPPSFTTFDVICVTLIACAPIASGWRSFKVIWTKFPFTTKSELLDVKVQIINNSSESYISVVQQVNEELNNVYFTYAIAMEKTDGNYTALVNHTVNFCKFLKQPSIDPVLRIIYDDIQRQGNFYKQCPMKKGIYALHEYHVNEEMLPNYTPEASFYIYIQLGKANGEQIFEGKLYGKIDKSRGFNNLKMFSLG